MNSLSWSFTILGILCYAYAVIIFCYAGSSASYLWFWPSIGSVFWLIAICSFLAERRQCLWLRYLVRIFTGGTLVMGIVLLSIVGILLVSSAGEPTSEPDYILVLGAKVRGTKVSKALRERLDCTVTYAKKHPQAKIIVSGGRGEGEDITEAQAMYEYLINAGIDGKRVIREECSTNTAENFQYSLELVGDKQKNFLVVSNRFHIYRAVAIGKKMGVRKIQGLAASTDGVMRLHYYLREAFAVVKYKLSGTI